MKNTLSQINNAIKTDAAEFIKQQERLYHSTVDSLAQDLANDSAVKIVCLAGPSASGKTTSAHILRQKLYEKGTHSQVISLDDFFLSSGEAPLLPDGRQDTESVNALDINEIERCLNDIIERGECVMPVFDFKKGMRSENKKRVNTKGGIVIVEGLHALNPTITEHLSREKLYKVYVSVNSAIYDDEGQKLLSSRQLRLARRALRDEIFRNSDINRTLHLWSSVIEGEEKYLYQYKPLADKLLVTLHAFEPCLYRERFIKMTEQVDEGYENYEYFMRTANAIKLFAPIDSALLPHNSLIREFIG